MSFDFNRIGKRAGCHLVAAIAVMALFAGTAWAAGLSSGRDQCFARAYDNTYLAKHSEQSVTAIFFSHRPSLYDAGRKQLARGRRSQTTLLSQARCALARFWSFLSASG